MDTDARKKARAKYRETNRTVKITLEVPEQTRNRWKAQAAAAGKSLTAFIADLIEKDLNVHFQNNDEQSPF